LLGKRYIFVQSLELKTLSLAQFLDFVKNKIIIQKAISQSKGQMNKFYSVWKLFLSLLENGKWYSCNYVIWYYLNLFYIVLVTSTLMKKEIKKKFPRGHKPKGSQQADIMCTFIIHV